MQLNITSQVITEKKRVIKHLAVSIQEDEQNNSFSERFH